LRLTYPRPEEPANLSLSRLLPGATHVLARAEVEAARDSWHRLGMRVSGGWLTAQLDGREVFSINDDLVRGHGQIGLFAEVGSAFFDDVQVRPWQALPRPVGGDGPWNWQVQSGRSSSSRGALALIPRGDARALAPAGEYTDVAVSTQVRMNKARGAGVLVRYRSPRDHYRVALERQGGHTALQVVRVSADEESVLARVPVKVKLKNWTSIEARVRDRTIEGWVNGERVLTTSDYVLNSGQVGLYCAGRGQVAFRETRAEPLASALQAADPPTPPFAGIIDLHTWAGRGSGWQPVPADPEMFWHRGFYPADVQVRLGVHRLPDGRASASLALGDGSDPTGGYLLRAAQTNAAAQVELSLLRRGEQIATGRIAASDGAGYALSLERAGNLLIAGVNGSVAVTFRDPEPLTDAVRAGFRRDAAVIDPADLDVLSPDVRTWIFKTAPADWEQLEGTWQISNRWSCSPQWTWLAGWNQTGVARILSRERYTGDMQVDFFIAARMMPYPDGRKGHYEELRDLLAGLCEDRQGGGYQVIIGADKGTRSVLQRNGQVVATNTSWAVPQHERHNNWLHVTLVKRGGIISVRAWDNEILRWEDPDPLEGGRVSLGTDHNGVIIPRVTIYGRPASL
ncbi:MAG: DUF1080 domain-containing protein, partial [Armatimonadetes bacterium]|nr:DUF1080 domain-containing protein [Armatimonadota bacterium]